MTNRKRSAHAVLIVEDDELLKMLTVDMVQRAGFEVIQAENADEAMTILKARSDIALVLTDINMPGSMDGFRLAHAVSDRWPRIKIIVTSSQVPKGALPTGSRFFVKPYRGEAMISEIHSLIGPRIGTS